MKSRFIRAVSAPNSWEDHHHLILSLRPVMGIQRAGYQTVQSAGKTCTQTYAHTHAHKHTWGEKERKKTRLWHIWSSQEQLRVSYRCWREAKSQNANERNRERERERKREGHVRVRTPPVLIPSRKLITKLFVDKDFFLKHLKHFKTFENRNENKA